MSQRLFTTVTLALALCGVAGCKNETEKQSPIPPPPPRGAASLDQLSTGLGTARGLDATLAAPSTHFDHVFVLDDKRAILAGGVPGGEAVALITLDAGKTWRSLRVERDSWSTWSFGEEATFALALGPKDGALGLPPPPPPPGKKEPPPPPPPFQLFFASVDAPSFGTATNVEQPPLPKKLDPGVPLVRPRVALLGTESAAFVVETAPKKFALRYVGAPGFEAPPEFALPKLETFALTPLGRPPRLFSVKGRELLARKWPELGKPVGDPEKVTAVKVTPQLVSELSAAPVCESGDFAFQRITQPPGKPHLLVVGRDKITLVPMPAEAEKDARIGCAVDGKFIVESPDADKQSINLLLCDLDGKCTAPSRPVYRPWIEKHERQFVAAPTDKGAVGVVVARVGERWGLYHVQSSDDGNFYERARVIGEGAGDRGKLDFGALVSFGKRTLLLISADVTGTSRRGWYAVVSDDGGETWNPP
jgi:hypothetical protein